MELATAEPAAFYGEQFLVATVALVIAAGSTAAGLGGWRLPYRLGSVRYIERRFGTTAARALLLVIAAAMIASATRILAEVAT